MNSIGIENGISITATANDLIFKDEILLIMTKYLDLKQDCIHIDLHIAESIFSEINELLHKLISVEDLEATLDKKKSIRYMDYNLESINKMVCIDRFSSNQKKIMSLDTLVSIIKNALKNPKLFYYYFLSDELCKELQTSCMKFKKGSYLTIDQFDEGTLFKLNKYKLIRIVADKVYPTDKMLKLFYIR